MKMAKYVAVNAHVTIPSTHCAPEGISDNTIRNNAELLICFLFSFLIRSVFCCLDDVLGDYFKTS